MRSRASLQILFGIPGVAAIAIAGMSSSAYGQATYDPPTAQRPPPNVMAVMDATRTTLIDGQGCGSSHCHVEANCGGHSGKWDCGLYRNGGTRLQLARRVLTGGWGWGSNATVLGSDAQQNATGVMDYYKVRWGVTYYDGLGPRLAVDPTSDNEAAQKAVIDFGNPPNDTFGPGGAPLNSFVPYPRTTRCCGNRLSAPPYDYTRNTDLPWYDEASGAHARQSQVMEFVRNYWQPGTPAPQWVPGPMAATSPTFFPSSPVPNDTSVIDSDTANVLVSSGAAGCRRNITILMTDGHGGGAWGGLTNGEWAGEIYNMPGPSGALSVDKRNQVFAIHFGVADKPNADAIADYGWDGVAGGGGITQSFAGAPGGVIPDLSAMLAAFSAIFSTVLAGDYIGAAPTVSRLGDYMAKTFFKIKSCAGLPPWQCNIGREGFMEYRPINPDGTIGNVSWDAGLILRSRLHTDRNLYTTRQAGNPNAANETNCGPAGTCANRSALLADLISANFSAPLNGFANFMRGDPLATFANGVMRGDSDGDFVIDSPFKLSSVANSRAVMMGAPPGIGEELDRWSAFRDRPIARSTTHGGDGTTLTVKERDMVVFVGGNDGYLHAFLAGQASATTPKGQSVAYEPIGAACPTAAGPGEFSQTMCDGLELWGYSPRMLHGSWADARSGHIYMVDGTPVIEDVLFTKNRANKGTVCSTYPCADTSWEYRTVLVNCLGAGGPGCFAMDVTNPWDPQLLWEREFTAVSGKGTSTSRPVIGKVKRTVTGTDIPYYVAMMGGGHKEVGTSGAKGTFVVVGLEDGRVFTSPTTAEADFAGEPSCLDVDGDSFVDTCYITTTNASVYKVRFNGGDPASMTMEKFFDGRHTTAASNPNIRSFTKVVATAAKDNKIDLFFATGNIDDVAQPGEQNYLFKIRDLEPLVMTPWTAGLNTDRQTNSCTAPPADLTAVTDGTLRLANGEKVLFNPTLLGGTVFFTSYRPNNNPCLDGQGYLYGVRYDTCDEGVDTNDDNTPDEEKVPLGPGLPSEPTSNYAENDVYVANSDNTIYEGSGKPPQATVLRLMKLWWREKI